MSYSKIKLKENLNEYSQVIDDTLIKKINYRPFDRGYMYYIESMNSDKNNIPIPKSYRSRYKVMRNMTHDNVSLIIGRQGQVVGDMTWNLSFISNSIVDLNMFYRGGGMVFPLYLYPESSTQQNAFETSQERVPNLNMEIVEAIAKKIGLQFVNEKKDAGNVCMANSKEVRNDFKESFAPIDLLDYIYAVLHSPTYREKYKEFLKIDFPRVPYPKDQKTFWQLVELGSQIRELHLLESELTEKYKTKYPIDGDNVVGKSKFENSPPLEGCPQDGVAGKVFINETQYFENVPEIAWNFYIGGYQPAQKWLKDRKDRTLSYEDIFHYQKIIVALTETDRVMREIDLVEI